VTSDLFAMRSILFLPASNPRAIAKARQSAADLVVLDRDYLTVPDDQIKDIVSVMTIVNGRIAYERQALP